MADTLATFSEDAVKSIIFGMKFESTPKSRKMLIFNLSLPRPLKGKC